MTTHNIFTKLAMYRHSLLLNDLEVNIMYLIARGCGRNG
jgi:hypothetical protein